MVSTNFPGSYHENNLLIALSQLPWGNGVSPWGNGGPRAPPPPPQKKKKKKKKKRSSVSRTILFRGLS